MRQRTESGRQRAEGRGQKAEAGGLRAEIRGQARIPQKKASVFAEGRLRRDEPPSQVTEG